MLPWHLKGSRFRGRSSELEAKDRALLAVLPWVSHLTSLSLCLLVCKIGACLPHTKTRLSELCAFWAQESASNLQMHSALYPKVLAEACSLPSPDRSAYPVPRQGRGQKRGRSKQSCKVGVITALSQGRYLGLHSYLVLILCELFLSFWKF